VGSGRSELGAALFGLDRIAGGTLRVEGELRSPRSPRDAMACGFGLLPEDRRLQGLMMRMSVLENATLAVPPWDQRMGFHSPPGGAHQPGPGGAKAGAELSLPLAPVSQLSGGNQAEGAAGALAAGQPHGAVLDDPTRGIDIGASRTSTA